MSDDLLDAPPLICSAQLASKGSTMQGPFLVAEVSLQLGSPLPSYALTAPLVIASHQASRTRYLKHPKKHAFLFLHHTYTNRCSNKAEDSAESEQDGTAAEGCEQQSRKQLQATVVFEQNSLSSQFTGKFCCRQSLCMTKLMKRR